MKRWAKESFLYYVAGVLLIAEYLSIWLLDKPVVLEGLDYIAWTVWAVSAFLAVLPMFVLRRKGRVPKGGSYVDTDVLVDTGIYALVRHPQYLGWLLMYVALILFNPHLPITIVGVLGMVCVYLISRQEDRQLVERFGELYERYMQSVPRMNLLAGVIRLTRRRRRQ